MFSAENKHKYLSDDFLIIWFILAILVVKLFLLPYTQTIDADAVSRVLLSEKWLAHPHLITDGVWAPLHFYFNAFVLWIFDERVVAPKILNIVFSTFAIWPFYHFVKRIFVSKGAIYAALLLGLSPIIFRNGFQALSGSPYLFFACLSLYFLARGLTRQDRKSVDFIYAGLSITVAAGLRYEAWVLIACLTLVLLLYKKWKETLFFWLAAMIFPFFWMIVGQVYHDDFLFGVNGAYTWNVELMGVNENLNDTERIKRIFFFPFSWFLAVSPFISWIIIYSCISGILKKRITLKQYIWLIPLVVIGVSFLLKAQNGTLLLQHRFTASLVLFSSPLLSLFFYNSKKWKEYLTFGLIFLMPFMAYYWFVVDFSSLTPFSKQIKTVVKDVELSAGAEALTLPSFDDDVPLEICEVIEANTDDEDGLLIDFVGWSKTYYWALNSNVYAGDICIFQGATNGVFDFRQFYEIAQRRPNGVLVMYCGSDHLNNFQFNGSTITTNSEEFKLSLSLKLILSKEGVNIYRYTMIDDPSDYSDYEYLPMNCPEVGSAEEIIMTIKNNTQMMNDIHKKAFKNGISFNEMLQRDVQYIIEHSE